MSSLFVILGAGQGIRHQLLKSVVTIGRDASSVLHLHDSEVSRRHAEIRHHNDADYLVDLESSNGVYVNGKRVREQRLENGDQIQIGKTLFLYTRTSKDHSKQDKTPAPYVEFQQGDQLNDQARIIHSVKQEEGSRLFDPAIKTSEYSWLAEAQSHLQMMYHTTLVVSQTLDIDQLLHRIMELIFEWVRVDRGCILLFDPEGERLAPRVSRIRMAENFSERMTLSKRILDYVLANREGVLTSDAQKDERWESDGSIVRMGIREAICVPMQGRYSIVGVIYIDTATSAQEAISLRPHETKSLTTDHLKLMIAIAHQAALAVEDTRHYLGMIQAERLAAVGQTVAVLSHHIKNILQGISGGSYLIEKGLADTNHELLAKGWHIVEKNQSKISDLVLDMLTFSKEREPNLASDDINRVVGDVIELMQGRANELDVQLFWEPMPNIPAFLFDAGQIHRAVTNIVTNALDAACALTPNENGDDHGQAQTGCVDVRTEWETSPTQEPIVRIIIDDNGVGIPPEMHDMLFRPFFSQKKGSGTGLGLAVTYKIFEEHHGRITIKTSPRGGARFVLELPMREKKM